MQHWHLKRITDSWGISRRSRISPSRCESNVVIRYKMNSSPDRVIREFAQPHRFVGCSLANKGRIAVALEVENWAWVAIVLLLCSCFTNRDCVLEFEMRGVVDHRDRDWIAWIEVSSDGILLGVGNADMGRYVVCSKRDFIRDITSSFYFVN